MVLMTRLHFRNGLQTLFAVCGFVFITVSAIAQSKPVLRQSGNMSTQVSNPGIVIFDPVVTGSDKALTDFGSGCSRWLFLHVGGLPQCGTTPLWNHLDRVRKQLHQSDLQLSGDLAGKFAKLLVTTHYVTATVSGGPKLQFQYQLHLTTSKQTVGPPITASGTRAEIVASLPKVAREIAARIGVVGPVIPPKSELDALELQQVGNEFRNITPDEASGTTIRLKTLWIKSSLAGMVCMGQAKSQEEKAMLDVSRPMYDLAPRNTLVIGACIQGMMQPIFDSKPKVQQYIREFPSNSLLQICDLSLHAMYGEPALRMASAKGLTKMMPTKPEVWLALGQCFADAAQALRRSRNSDKISEAEWETLRPLYAENERVCKIAVSLDPNFGIAWYRLAVAAPFADDIFMADKAYWKALELLPGNPEVYDWGIQLYDRKWIGDLKKRAKVAAHAASDFYASVNDMESECENLDREDYQLERLKLIQRSLSRLKEIVRKYPGDSLARYNYGLIFAAADMHKEALREFEVALKQYPYNGVRFSFYADELTIAGRHADALAQHQTALRLTPGHTKCLLGYAYGLLRANRVADAEKEARKQVIMFPFRAPHRQVLGLTLVAMKKYDEAIKVYGEGLQAWPTWMPLFVSLSDVYLKMGQLDNALKVAQRAVQLVPVDPGAQSQLSTVLAVKKEFGQALLHSQIALKIAPNNPVAHISMGNALFGLGRKAEARAEWQKAMASGVAEHVEAAAALLKTHA